MKRIYKSVLGLSLLLFGLKVNGQVVAAYGFTQTAGTYSAITGGTVYGSTTSDDQIFVDPAAPLGQSPFTSNNGVGLPIGFNFTFNNHTYDVIGISNNGWISFGQSALGPNALDMDVTTYTDAISATSSTAAPISQNKVVGFDRDLQAQTGSELRMQVLGTSPSRTVVVQYTNYRRYSQTGDNFNFQIRLHETTNIVSIVYGSNTVSAASFVHVGLRGDSNTDFNNRDVTSPVTWANSSPGAANSAVANISSTLVPASGQTYKWTPPVICSGMPSAGTVPASFTICPNSTAVITNTSSNSFSGITYQWQQSTTSTGPWTNVTTGSGFNSTSLTTSTLGSLTYYHLVITCTATSQSATTAVVSVNPNNPFSLCYCTSGLGGGGCVGNNISNVSILSTPLNNTSGCNLSSGNSYTQFSPSASTTATLNGGGSYSMSVNTTANNNISFWIDYDHSGTFDPSEFYQVTTASTANAATVLFFNVPASALGGQTGLRVRTHSSFATVTSSDACSNFYDGETEDYVITINAATPCSGAPTPGTIAATPTLICSGGTVNMNLSGFTVASGLTFQWQQAAASTGPWSAVTGATVTSLSQAITATTFFRVIVACGTNTAATAVVQVSLQPASLCYCNQSLGGSGCSGDNITNVTIVGTPLNNNSTCNSNSTNGTYSQFLQGPTTTATLSQGASYSISVNTTASNIESVWIDYDHSGTFDPNEHTQITLSSTANAVTTAVFSVPATASLGVTGMRVRSRGTGNINGPTDACTNFGSGETEDYFVTINPGTPCSGAPASNTIVTSMNNICPGSSVNLALANTYTTLGITYQWSTATVSTGPYTTIPGATLTTFSTPNLTATTWYSAIVTCSAGPASTTITALAINVQSVTVNTVPYNEGFEGITVNNQLPNCSWTSTSPGTICLTYTATPPPTVYNRIPHTGSKFASFRWGTNTSGDYFYSNGIQLTAGTTYSANAFYITDGTAGWSEFSIWYGTSQSSASLTNIASATGALTNTTYVSLGNTFVAPTTGIYYIAIKAIGNSGPWYLTWDDLSVTALPACSGTPASNTVVASSSLVCTGSPVTLTLATTYTNGGYTYQWSTATALAGPYTAITGATLSSYTNPNVTASLYYRAVITCTAGPASTTATPVQVNVLASPVYATVPFLENFDNTWQNRCDNHNVPVTANWDSNPTTGNNSWRRQDDGSTAAWSSNIGINTPLAGAGCANFHSYNAQSGTQGDLNLYVNMNASNSYSVSFYYQNLGGTDSLQVFVSTNGGSTFNYNSTYFVDPVWNKKSFILTAVNSPSCVIKFKATSDYGNDDIGIDSLKIINFTCAAPTITLAASQPTACSGSSLTLTASGATSYTWSTGANTNTISIAPTVNTTYTVTGSSTPGCTGSKTISINVVPGPSLTVAAVPSLSLCPGMSASLTASGANNYTWTPGNATTAAISVTPNISTVYNVVGTNSLGCSTNSNVTVIVQICTGIAKNTVIDNSTFVYPNPNNGNVNVVIENSNGSYSFEVSDLSGRLVYKTTLTKSESAVSIKELANGMYTYKIISLTGKQAVKEGKLIKE